MKTHRQLTTESLLSIGEMAQLFRLNIRTLRYYDDIGLLKPEYVNEQTKYRYYSVNQFERLNTILYLRSLDIPLEKIANFFAEKDLEVLIHLLEDQHQLVLQKQEELLKIEQKIMNRLTQLQLAKDNAHNQISIQKFPERKLVLLKQHITLEDNLEIYIKQLARNHSLEKAVFLGKVGLSIGKQDLLSFNYEQYSALFILVEEVDQSLVPDSIPAGWFATIQFQGTHQKAKQYYHQLLDYIKTNQYQVIGDSIEITLIDAGITNDDTQFVTQIQIPIQMNR